jgi:hypothetical protein
MMFTYLYGILLYQQFPLTFILTHKPALMCLMNIMGKSNFNIKLMFSSPI